jgi:hypothetical protein
MLANMRSDGVLHLRGLGAVIDRSRKVGTRAVEQIRCHTDHGFQQIVLNHVSTNSFLFTAAKQNAVRHDGSNHTAVASDGQHMLQEHQIRLLGAQRHLPVTEPL